MLIKRKLSLVFLFILFTTSCDLSNGYVKPEELEEPEEPRVVYRSIQLYNEDGTKFTGNGKIYLYYTGIDGSTVEGFYADVTNGEYGRRSYSYYENYPTKITYIDPDYSINSDIFFNSIGSNVPSFAYKPSNYNDSKISISISNLTDNVECTNLRSSFWNEKKFYDDNTPGEYKLLVDGFQTRDEKGYVTRRRFYTDFLSYSPEPGLQYINGKLQYTKVLTNLHNNKTEKADVTIIYFLDFGLIPTPNSYSFSLRAYVDAFYTIIEEKPDSIHYEVVIRVGERGSGSLGSSQTLIDKNFRMRP